MSFIQDAWNMIIDFLDPIREFLDEEILKNWDIDTQKLFTITAITFAILFIIYRLKNHTINKLQKISKKTEINYDDELIERMKSFGLFFYLTITLLIVTQFMGLEGNFKIAVSVLSIIVISGKLSSLVNLFSSLLLTKRKGGNEEVDLTIKSLLNIALKVVIWIVAFLLVFSALGQDLSTLVAGLGVSGIILGFALQNVMSDLFSSISIYFDQPFKIGDFVVIGDDNGTVKNIGLKSTRIKTLRGEELVISNKELSEIRIRNFKKLRKRRVAFELGVTYNTPRTKIAKIPKIIEKIVEKVDKAEFDRCYFSEFGDFSLKIEVVYNLNSGDIEKHVETKHQINLEIMKAFEKEKIKFAFPTQTIYLEK